MSVYAIGDVQGCYNALRKLLDKLKFKADRDQLWFAGDLVNRGPKSLQTLRFVKDLGDNAITVLGNHDLHLLAVAYGHRDICAKNDSFHEVLKAPDYNELIDWLRSRPLMHHDKKSGFTLVHAGLSPQWDLKLAKKCNKEMTKVLKGEKINDFLANMYGNTPNLWTENLQDWDRLRFIINSFTRIRYCDAEGREDFKYNQEVGSQPEHLMPWFHVPNRKNGDLKIIFGHWASLGLYQEENIYALDSGCVWGGSLSAMKINKHLTITQVGC